LLGRLLALGFGSALCSDRLDACAVPPVGSCVVPLVCVVLCLVQAQVLLIQLGLWSLLVGTLHCCVSKELASGTPLDMRLAVDLTSCPPDAD